MLRLALLALLSLAVACPFSPDARADESATVLLEDNFNRTEADPDKEQVGGEWKTNSKSRASGNKQVDLVDGAVHITRHEVADHGVSLVHDVEFKDVVFTCRFKIGKGDDLGINIADMNEKSVHAGHICMTRIKPFQVMINDLKTGNMNLEIRNARRSKTMTDAQKAQVKETGKLFKNKVALDQWHDLKVEIQDATMTVSIDGEQVGEFTSPGIAHPTKNRLRIAVNREAWIDDVKMVSPDN